jgi:DNA-binding winged helix-turn-helix (wHTH) protein/tetratricopeptide (TPR) repeat protein
MSPAGHLRFGTFELRSASGELRQQGDLVKLSPQPFKVLDLLARRAGEIVTRHEIREHVWPDDTFVDFDQGLNFCIRQVREALGDAAGAPRFIETLPRRGYRFLMPVTVVAPDAEASTPTRLIVLPFRLLRPDPDTAFLAFSLPDAITASLSGLESLVVRSSLAAARYADGGAHASAPDPKAIAAEQDVDMIVTGTLLRAADHVRVTAQMTDAATCALVWSDTAQAPVHDLFRLQDELTHRIVGSLSLPLTAREQQRLGRDVPANARAYEFYLRGNQLSYDSQQWAVARDLYLRAVDEDPRYAPAWARLGRIHHVMGKYLDTGSPDGLDLAEAAFVRALALNPDLPLTHKLYAQVEVDRGRAQDAMARLIARARIADPELLAGLVTTCRYCGLLEASVGAHARAVALEPKIRTSVGHTWFLQGDYARLAAVPASHYPYIVPLALAEIGRADEGLARLRELEPKIPTRVRHLVSAARALLEDEAAESLAEVLAADIRDPEAFYYAARHCARLGEPDHALAFLAKAIDGGFSCAPAMTRDPWLEPLRRTRWGRTLIERASARHREAAAVFAACQGAEMVH